MDSSRRFFLRARPARAVQRPPGAGAEPEFLRLCTRCDACVQACPPGVIRRGDGGFPVMDFSSQGCNFCGACQQACRPSALNHTVATAFPGWQATVGATCLAHRGVECRVCGDACDVRAIRFPPIRGGVASPRVDPAACSGCGACVGVCPTQAISVTGDRSSRSG